MAKRRGRLMRLFMWLSLVGVAATVAAPFVPLPPLKNEVEVRLSEALGRRVTVDSARLNLMPRPYITLKGMTAQESPAFGEGVFLRADNVRADVDLIQYLRTRRFAIDSITLISPQINLTKNADGVWSWTTLGRQRSEQASLYRSVSALTMNLPVLSILSLFWDGGLSTPSFKSITIENASARLIDRTGSQPPETLYKNISLTASVTPHSAGDSVGSQATGQLTVHSEEDGEADALQTNLPFDLRLSGGTSALLIDGQIGPGRIESKNLDVGSLTITGNVHSEKGGPLTGSGEMSANEMLIRTINLSEQVSRALKVDQIGDMSPGTVIASLTTGFQINRSTINTTGLRIQQLDGLGDATAENGSFKIEAALTVNYAATLIMSTDATTRVKAISPIVGMLVTILETDNRISVPINISGDVRKPEIQVDVSRIF